MKHALLLVTVLRLHLLAVLGAAWMAGPAFAQALDVTLEGRQGDLFVSGRLLEVTDDTFVVVTQIGQIELEARDVTCSGLACPYTGALPETEIPEQMRRIQLSSLDKSVDVKGQLVGLTEDRRIVDVANIGLVSLSTRGLRCSGPGCRVTWAMVVPPPPPARPLQIVGPKDLTDGVLAPLLRGYASSVGSTEELRSLSDSTYLMSLDNEFGTFFVGATDTSVAFDALATGAADFVVTARQPNTNEVERLIAAGLGDPRGSAYEITLGVAALSVVTQSDLGISQLSIEQVSGIYRGEITNWSDVGGPDQPITVLARAPGSSERSVFNQYIFGDPMSAAVQRGIIVSSTRDMVDIVNSDRFAIGYAFKAASDGLAQIDLVGSCGLKKQDDVFSYRSGDAGMATRLYLYINAETQNDQARAFAEYAGSMQSHASLGESQFHGAKVDRRPLSDMRGSTVPMVLKPGLSTQVAMQLMGEVEKWDRLSTTFRYAGDDRSLSAEQRKDMSDLIAYLKDLPVKSQIAVIGFSNSVADFEFSMERSNADAVFVADQLAELGQDVLGGTTVLSGGYGHIAQVACDADPNGSRLNRRVEIWVPKNNL